MMNESLTSIFGTDKTAKLLIKYNYQPKTNDILAGTIIGIERKNILVNIGLKDVAFLPMHEVFIDPSKKPSQILQKSKAGEFTIIGCVKKKNILSMRRLHYLRLWERFKQIDYKKINLYTFFEKKVFSAKVVDFDGLKIYLPNGHLSKYNKKISKKKQINRSKHSRSKR